MSLTGNDELSSTHAGGKLFVWKVCTGRGNNGWRSKGAAVQRGQAMNSTLTWVLIFQDVSYNFVHSCRGLTFQDVSYNFMHSPILSDRKNSNVKRYVCMRTKMNTLDKENFTPTVISTFVVTRSRECVKIKEG